MKMSNPYTKDDCREDPECKIRKKFFHLKNFDEHERDLKSRHVMIYV